MFMNSRLSRICFNVVCVSTLGFSQTTRLEPLSTVRNRIVVGEMSAEEKLTLAKQAQVFLRDLYVHRFHKARYYNQPDPARQIQKLVDNVDRLSSRDLEYGIMKIFNAQRDLHLNFYLAKPHGLYTSFLPLTFRRTAGAFNYFEARVGSVNTEQFQQFAAGQRVPAVGDELVSYNGVPVAIEAHNRLSWAQGANEFGGFSRALVTMAYLNHKRFEVPATDTVRLKFRSFNPHGKGETYTVTIPWITKWVEPAPGLRMGAPEKPQPSLLKRFNLGMDDFQQDYQAFLKENRLEPVSALPSNPTSEGTLTWGTIQNPYGTFGYVKIASFSPTTTVANAQSELKRLLTNELKDTKGLVLDVRDNGGGYIDYADELPQFFSRTDAQVLDFRLLNGDVNWRLYNETDWGKWYPLFKEQINASHGNGKIYTGTAQFTTDLQANTVGQLYYKPVALLTNAQCYSACDMFASSMQDNKAAVVYGEEPRTGAGGANVLTHEDFLKAGPSDLFQPLPSDHAMRVSWRQTVRFGKHEGQILEDDGCRADVDISPTAQDLLSGGAAQIQKVTQSLALRSLGYQATVRGEGTASEVYVSRHEASYGVYVSHTPTVLVYVNGELRDRISANAWGKETLVRYTLPADLPSGKAHRVTFAGVSFSDKPLWNLKRRITVLDEKVVLGATPLAKDFATATSAAPLTLVNSGEAAPEKGWNLVNPYLQVGYTPNYADYIDTDAILFMDLRNRTSAKLEFGLEYDTEQDYDFFEVQISSRTTRKVLMSVSGQKPMARYTLDLSEFAGQDNVALHFRFLSDTNTNAPGVKISDFTIQ